jgi:hypothetical protein
MQYSLYLVADTQLVVIVVFRAIVALGNILRIPDTGYRIPDTGRQFYVGDTGPFDAGRGRQVVGAGPAGLLLAAAQRIVISCRGVQALVGCSPLGLQ